MAVISDAFRAYWRSAFTTGPGGQFRFIQKPTIRVEIRRGRFSHGYAPWTDDDPYVGATFFTSTPEEPWQATWIPAEDYIDIPGVLSCDIQQEVKVGESGGGGIASCTLILNNTIFREMNGFAGIYHLIERGALSPWRGYAAPYRPAPTLPQNEWFDRLNRNAQVKVWMGWSDDTMVPVFVGLIDKLDLTSNPDQITVNIRDMGQVLPDQKTFGWVKDGGIRDPIVFADRLSADDTARKGASPSASSSADGYPPTGVIDKSTTTAWRSQRHTAPGVTEWVQVKVPKGRYETLILDTRNFAGMEAFIGIKEPGEDWKVMPDAAPEDVTVPGEHGGWTYIKRIGSTQNGQTTVRLGQPYFVDDNTIFRVGFRKLKRVADGKYQAGVATFAPIWRKISAEAKKQEWILVDDAADVVRVVLRWAGFKNWLVEDSGVRLKEKWIVNRQNSLLDIISKMCEKTGFCFFIADPSSADDSMGLPVFRQNSVLIDADNMEHVTDSDLLTGIQASYDEEPLSYNIRIRGATASKMQGGVHLGGTAPGTPSATRYMSYYKPPWAREGRLSGVIKHRVVNRFDLQSEAACMYAGFLVALHEALESMKAVVEIPGNPGINPDDHVSLIDNGTGLNTRMWIAARSHRFVAGRNASWRMTLAGTLIDTEDIVGIRNDIVQYAELLDDQVPTVIASAPQPTTSG